MKNTKLVWSNDPKDQPKLNPQEENSDTHGLKSKNFIAIFRIEKKGRGGKTVTVIDNLPKIDNFLRQLTKEIKNKCGSGGTYSLEGKEGLIEIQGDKRVQIKALFEQKGFKFKGM